MHTTHNNTTTMSIARRHAGLDLGKMCKKNKQPQGTGVGQTTINGASVQPPLVVETVSSSSQSQTSSIGIGEFGMNPSRRGNAAAFTMAIKESLFPKLKFLQGTNASLDFSMDTTSICGYLRVCCGVSEADACQWWHDHHGFVKNIHTDCRNNKIKMLKLQFNGKLS
jgi:hypothetical protein